jgi:hypothetical protein
MSTKDLSGGGDKAQPARKDNLNSIFEPIIYKMWGLDFSQTYGPSRPLTGIILHFMRVVDPLGVPGSLP